MTHQNRPGDSLRLFLVTGTVPALERRDGEQDGRETDACDCRGCLIGRGFEYLWGEGFREVADVEPGRADGA